MKLSASSWYDSKNIYSRTNNPENTGIRVSIDSFVNSMTVDISTVD
jgi:hypothetical protein